MTRDIRLSNIYPWANGQADEALLRHDLSARVQAHTRWVLRLSFEAALDTPPFTVVVHADMRTSALHLTLSALTMTRSHWVWRRIEEAAPQWPDRAPASRHPAHREVVRLTGAAATSLQQRIEGGDLEGIGDIVGGGYDGYEAAIDFRSASMAPRSCSSRRSFDGLSRYFSGPVNRRCPRIYGALVWIFSADRGVRPEHLDHVASRLVSHSEPAVRPKGPAS